MDLPSILLCILWELLGVSCQGIPELRTPELPIMERPIPELTIPELTIPEQRIVGGFAAGPHSIKYIVSIQKRSNSQHICGGTVINKFWVLTAAHCNVGVDNMRIVAGDYSLNMYEGTEQFRPVHLLIPHPEYNNKSNDLDIMLLKVRDPIILNNYVTIAPLPRQGAPIAEGRLCRVSGWGYTSAKGDLPMTLMTVKLPIISTEKCNSSYGNITANMICAGYSAGGKDSCKGDSGGPMVCEGRVYGVVSWGNGCADPQYPGVYTAVSRVRRWIDRVIFNYYSRCHTL